jgi:hypothetical protein
MKTKKILWKMNKCLFMGGKTKFCRGEGGRRYGLGLKYTEPCLVARLALSVAPPSATPRLLRYLKSSSLVIFLLEPNKIYGMLYLKMRAEQSFKK